MANKLKPATKADGGKVIKALLKEGISKVEDTFGISNMAIQNVVYTNSTYYPECSVGCVLIEAHGEVVEDIITIMKKLGYRHAEDFGDGIVLVFAPKGVSDSDIGDALNGKINESVDISVSENVRSKIINYAKQRLNKSGAVLLAPVYDIINFNDPLDGMISFDYLNTIAENEELSEEESGYDYIEQAVTDIANFIQNQGYIMDEESDDPLIFIDENYDEEDDEELDDMNESVKWTETDEPNQWVNKLTKHKEAIDPITLECKDLGVAVFASKLSEDGNFYRVMVVASDTGKSITKSMPFDGIDLESAISKLKKCDNKDDLYNTISKYLFVRKESVSKLFGTNMNESTEMNEATSIKKSDRYREFDLLPKGKGWMDPIELTNRDAGFYAIAGTAYDSTDRNNEDEWGIIVSLTPLDSKYEDILITGSFYDYEEAADSIMNRLSRAKTPMDVARIIKNQKFSDEWGDDESEFLSALTKSFGAQNESTMMINEATKIKPGDPELEYFGLLDSNNPFDFEPVFIDNPTLGFAAIAGVATGSDPDADFDEDDCSIEVIVYTDNEDASQDTLVAEYYDVDYKAMQVMNELAKATQFKDLTNILVKEGFTGSEDSPFYFVESLEAANSMNEATEVPDGRMTVELDDTDVIEGDTLLLAELTDDVFNAVNAVLDELDPDADVEITIDNEDLLQLAVVSDEDLDDDAFDQVLSELLEDMDLEDIVADMTDSEPIEDPEDEDFGRVIQYINFYPSTGATVVPDNSVMEDNVDVIEDEESINESASTKTDFMKLLEKLADEFKKEFKSNPDVEGTSFSFVKKGKDKVVLHAIAGSVNPGARALSNYLDFLDDNGVEYKILQKFDYYKGALNCTIYTTIKIIDIKDEDVINESFKLNTDLTKFVDKLADSFFDSIKNANFLNLEDEDGNLYFQVSTGDKSYSRKLLTNFLAFLAKKNVDFDLVNKVNVTGNSTFWNATVTVKINNKQGSQVQYRNELNESTDVSDRRISHYVNDLNFKSGVKFLDGDDKIEKVLKAISPELDIRFYSLDKLPWTTYKIDGRDYVAVFGIANRLFTPMSIAITEGKNISDFVSNSKSILVFTNKKLQDWNNVVLVVRIMNNLAKVTDRASEYKAIKSLLTSYQKQVYNYEQFDESVDPIYESYYKDTEEDLSIDQAKITKALKAIDRILTKAGYPLDNLDKVYRFNYPRPGLVEINLINTLNDTYGYMGNKAYDIDSKIEKKLESLNLTYASKDKYGKEIYTDDDKLVHYDSKDISKYIQTGKVPDREFRNNRVDAVHPKLEDIAKGITEYLTSHPTYKKYNTYGYKPVNVGADYISIKVEVANVEYGKEILSDTDKYIKKNYKDLYPIIRSNPPDKKYPYIHYSLLDTGRPLGHLMKSEYEMRGSSIKKLMNESVDDDNSEAIGSYDYSESAKSPKLPTQSELKTIIQKSMIKFGERHTQVTVHAYRTSKYEGGVVEVDLDGTSLATDGREEDYYDEDNIKNALEYAAKELVDKFGQDKDLLDYIDVQYNKVGSLTITFSLDSELNESYSINEATKVTFHFDDQKDWVSPEDFKKIEKFAPKMEDALERYLRRLRDLGPDDKLKDQVYTEIRVENKEKIIIETKTKKKVLKKDIDRLYAKGNGPSPSTNLSQLPLDDVKATNRGIGWFISPIDKSLTVYVYTGFKSLAEPFDPAKAKAEWDAAHPKKPASALKSKLEEIAKGIEKYVKSHPDYKKFNLSKDVVHVGEDYIQITVDTPDAEVGKSILIDTDKFISKNYKDLETHSKSKDGSKPVWSVYVMKSSAAKDLMNESTKFDFDNLEEVLEEDLDSDIDLPDYADNIIVHSYPTGQGYGVKATFDDRLVNDNKLRIIGRIANTVASRCGKDYDLDHHHDKMRGEYSLTFSYKGSPFNECAIIGPDETDIDTFRANELSRALNSDQPLVDPYDIRCTIRPVFVRKDQFLFDGSTVYKATANASTDKDSGTTEIKVDVLLSDDPDITDASTTLTLPTEFDGLKLLRGNPTKVYNESADVKVDTVTLSFANEDEANEFIKDNGVKPEKSFEGKFGWTVILKKSDLKKIK